MKEGGKERMRSNSSVRVSVVVMGMFMFDCLFVLDSQPANER